jgi:predicted AlkP superfamily pyrophosphatase or phosphodiesterase
LDLGEKVIYPKYADQSILNIPGSVCRLMDIPQFGEPPLAPEIISPLGNGIRRVVLILVDALALHRLQRWMEDGTAPVWRTLGDEGFLAPLTSIVPSTTSACLTTFWTGRSPAAHGITGYEMWLKEYGVVANMILHAPMSFLGDVGTLKRAGFQPENFLPLPTFGPHLNAHGVKPYAFQHVSIIRSGLSQMFLRDVDVHGFSTPADLWVGLRQLMENQPAERLYAYVYYGAVDGLSHRHAPDDERVVAEFASFSSSFERFFLNRLSPEARKDTLLILTADHGMVATPDNYNYDIRYHPELKRNLNILPTGENRLTYLYIRPGQEGIVRDYFQRTWPGKFSLLDPELVIQSGLLGPGDQHPLLRDRLGDLIAVAHDDAYLWWSQKENFLIGRHGGMYSQEMLVPFLAMRF